jgi:cell division protein FtsB
MAGTARSRRPPAGAGTQVAAQRAGARTSRRPTPARVRWDRLSRAAMLFVLLVLLYLYISPVRSLVGAISQSSREHATLASLRAQNAHLKAERDSLQNPATLEQKARSLGLVLPGERAYVISGLPSN